ncbi:MAG: hypothetical protein L3K10_05610 [Thermoplasmata archaeon]|nr:hypothetical protein [Thermoplasmata archaeon]
MLEVARVRRVPLALEQLLLLLPPGAAWTQEDLRSCVASHPAWGRLVDGYVHAGVPVPDLDIAEGRLRSEAMIHEAEAAVSDHLRPAAAFVHCIGVSGSVAYGLAEPGDDLDFFVVARRGGAWLFLLLAFLGSRRAHRAGSRASPWCFNYVVEEGAADGDFGVPQGLMVAREALSVRLIKGDPFYRELLGHAEWMGAELPQLYALRTGGGEASPTPPPIGWISRLVNLLVYPAVATYLQMAALVGNHRLRRESPTGCFRTETTLHRYQLRTEHFDRLRGVYARGIPASTD